MLSIFKGCPICSQDFKLVENTPLRFTYRCIGCGKTVSQRKRQKGRGVTKSGTVTQNGDKNCHSATAARDSRAGNAGCASGTRVASLGGMEIGDMMRWITTELDPSGEYEWESL